NFSMAETDSTNTASRLVMPPPRPLDPPAPSAGPIAHPPSRGSRRQSADGPFPPTGGCGGVGLSTGRWDPEGFSERRPRISPRPGHMSGSGVLSLHPASPHQENGGRGGAQQDQEQRQDQHRLPEALSASRGRRRRAGSDREEGRREARWIGLLRRGHHDHGLGDSITE